MRIIKSSASWLGLIVACGALAAQSNGAGRELPKSFTVNAADRESAHNAAKVKAAELITAHMEGQRVPLVSFRVDARYVEEQRVLSAVVREGAVIKVKDKDTGRDVDYKEWTFTFRTDVDWWSEIVRKDREIRLDQQRLRAQEREQWTARAVLILAVLLLTGLGYLRFDEYTQRRYTAWLRLVSVGVAATILAGGLWILGLGGGR